MRTYSSRAGESGDREGVCFFDIPFYWAIPLVVANMDFSFSWTPWTTSTLTGNAGRLLYGI